MQKIVVDSSVIVKWISDQNEKNLEASDKLLTDCRGSLVELFTPELAKYEVGNVLWKKDFDLEQTKTSLATIYSGPLKFKELDKETALRTMQFASETQMTYYDASFVALAENLDAILVTDNPKHQSKFKGVKIVPLADYK